MEEAMRKIEEAEQKKIKKALDAEVKRKQKAEEVTLFFFL